MSLFPEKLSFGCGVLQTLNVNDKLGEAFILVLMQKKKSTT